MGVVSSKCSAGILAVTVFESRCVAVAISVLFCTLSPLGTGYWDSKYRKTSRLEIHGAVHITDSVSLKREPASLMNMYLAPLRTGRDAVTLAGSVAGLQLRLSSLPPRSGGASDRARRQQTRQRQTVHLYRSELGPGGEISILRS